MEILFWMKKLLLSLVSVNNIYIYKSYSKIGNEKEKIELVFSILPINIYLKQNVCAFSTVKENVSSSGFTVNKENWTKL